MAVASADAARDDADRLPAFGQILEQDAGVAVINQRSSGQFEVDVRPVPARALCAPAGASGRGDPVVLAGKIEKSLDTFGRDGVNAAAAPAVSAVGAALGAKPLAAEAGAPAPAVTASHIDLSFIDKHDRRKTRAAAIDRPRTILRFSSVR